jgi:hypothetical protein
MLGAPHRGDGRVSSSAGARDCYGRLVARMLAGWTRDYRRKAALADCGCAILGVFVAARLRFGNDNHATYVALSMALPVLWLITLWLTGGYDARFVGTGSAEFPPELPGVSAPSDGRSSASMGPEKIARCPSL